MGRPMQIRKRIRERREKVFLYGRKEELSLIADVVYGRGPVPYSGSQMPTQVALRDKPKLLTWQDAEQVTDVVSSNASLKDFPDHLVSYDSLRALGSGIQNVIGLAEWVGYVRDRLSQQGVDLLTYNCLRETKEAQISAIRGEIQNKRKWWLLRKKKNDREIISRIPAKIIFRGRLVNRDFTSKYVNTIEGNRVTQPNAEGEWKNTIHFFGASEVYGAHLRDNETVPSCFSNAMGQKDIRVLNHGMGGVNFIDVLARLLSNSFRKGDVVVLALPFTQKFSADCEILLDSSCFIDSSHLNVKGAELAASELHKMFKERTRLKGDSEVEICKKADCTLNTYKDLLCRIEAKEFEGSDIESYCKYLDGESIVSREIDKEPIFGSVAVNCNPITKGHLALIEFAANSVDYLYVLVIEEDKSAVSYKHRMNMVREVCSDYDNIKVLRGGRFVCTEYIAPEYFVKDEDQPENIDFSLESFYFGNFIAPRLKISKIFLGEEPTCNVTRQYNDHMLATMPTYGVELTIIPRRNHSDGIPISASRVRKLIKAREWDAVKELVPGRAFEYMQINTVL